MHVVSLFHDSIYCSCSTTLSSRPSHLCVFSTFCVFHLCNIGSMSRKLLPLFELQYVLTLLVGAATAQYSDPSSHGFTINAPGLTNTATFGYGAGGSSASAAPARVAVRPAPQVSVVRPNVVGSYVPLSSSYADSGRVTLTQRSFTVENVGSVGGPTGSVIGERRLLTNSNAVLPRQRVGAGVPSDRQGSSGGLATTVVSLSNRGSGTAPAPLPNYFGGNTGGRLVSTRGGGSFGGSPFNPTIQREPSRFQYAVSTIHC